MIRRENPADPARAPRRTRRASRALTILAVAGIATWSNPAGAQGAPGSLSQTRTEPSFGAPLTASMERLVSAIAADAPARAMGVFFPEAAYVHMKTGEIPDPAADYVDRLVDFYRLDIGAYHERLYLRGSARFLRVDYDVAGAQWIAPGTCENAIGYWHVGGVRLVFALDHRVVSVAVDSLISWRGVWYVVHLGPNPRPANVGTVDDYALGPGTPGPPGGC